MPQITPDYWDDACRHLGKRDRVMRKLIPQFPEGRLQSRGDAFTTLARSIVGQQISVKAAQAVWDRFAALMDEPSTRLSPAAVLALERVLVQQGQHRLPGPGQHLEFANLRLGLGTASLHFGA